MSEEQKEQALVPVEEKQVDFYGDEITAALVEVEGKSEVYVPLRPIAEYLGLNWSGQRQRLNRDAVLAEAQGVCMIHTPSGVQEMLCLPLELLPGWLFGVDVSRVKPELQEKVQRYRRECFKVLWQAFQNAALPFAEEGVTLTPTPREPNPILVQIRDQALAQARMSEALAKMAEQQIEIEARAMDAQEQAYYAHQRLDEFGRFVTRLNLRIGEVERAVQPGVAVTSQQAATISHAVTALANLLTSKLGPTDKAGKVHYQAIFNELYRRFGVADYKSIRQADYTAVLDFLDGWRVSAGGEPRPRQAAMPLDQPE